jgi:hypothetical protein
MRVLKLPVERPSLPGCPARRQLFSPEEDLRLTRLVDQFGTNSWDQVAWFMPRRTVRQCRDRYKNYLSAGECAGGPWTPSDDEVIRAKFRDMAPKWVEIAHHLPGRCGNDAKHRWYSHLAKALDDTAAPRRTAGEELGREERGMAQPHGADGKEFNPCFVREFRRLFLRAPGQNR